MTNMRVAEISLPALHSNVRRIIEVTEGATLIAVVKANGYGHDAAIIAQAAVAAGAKIIGVTDLQEAFSLREAGLRAPLISWLNGPGADFERALQSDITLGVSRLDQLTDLAAASQKTGLPATVHLKIDTGLSRGGLAQSDLAEAFTMVKEMQAAGQLVFEGIFSHLSNAGAAEDILQAQKFDVAVAVMQEAGLDAPLKHLASSAATFTSPHLRYNTVRVGLALYGLSPLDDTPAADLGLQPVMTLKAQIIARRAIATDVGVSYSYLYRASTDTELALVPIGYADGMPRLLNTAGLQVVVRGVRCEVVGRIAMDQCVVDLTPLGEAAQTVEVGEMVTFFGAPDAGLPTLDEWAQKMQTINYEIAARLGPRIKRVAVNEGQAVLGAAS